MDGPGALPISRHDTCKIPDFESSGDESGLLEVMQICIRFAKWNLAHSLIDYTENTAILLALRSNAANLLVHCYPRVQRWPCKVPGMDCIGHNYVVLGGSSGSQWS